MAVKKVFMLLCKFTINSRILRTSSARCGQNPNKPNKHMKQIQIEYDTINSSGEWQTVTVHEWVDEPSIYTAEIQQTHLVDIVETFKVEATDMKEAVRLALIEAREREQINCTTYNLNSITLDK